MIGEGNKKVADDSTQGMDDYNVASCFDRVYIRSSYTSPVVLQQDRRGTRVEPPE